LIGLREERRSHFRPKPAIISEQHCDGICRWAGSFGDPFSVTFVVRRLSVEPDIFGRHQRRCIANAPFLSARAALPIPAS
jgi:hypothetical protein